VEVIAMGRKVTFGDDGSPGADTAWGWITSQAWPQWQLDVITVDKPLPGSEVSPLGYDDLRVWEPDHPRGLPPDCGFTEVTYLTAHHDPRIVLGLDLRSDLLVIGPRGKGLLKALHIGSTVEWLAQCPMTPLVVARDDGPTRTVLACVDGSAHADAVVDVLAKMPWIAQATVTVLAVVESDNDIREHAQAAVERLTTAGATVELRIEDPEKPISVSHAQTTVHYVINEMQPDLVALGTRGLGGMQRLLLGSLASSVIRHSGRTVLLARDSSIETS
jgi:nucleotide-binding universal stress UspA family protein